MLSSVYSPAKETWSGFSLLMEGGQVASLAGVVAPTKWRQFPQII
jgi:hypothetical protein